MNLSSGGVTHYTEPIDFLNNFAKNRTFVNLNLMTAHFSTLVAIFVRFVAKHLRHQDTKTQR
jgi:hypothetical protein